MIDLLHTEAISAAVMTANCYLKLCQLPITLCCNFLNLHLVQRSNPIASDITSKANIAGVTKNTTDCTLRMLECGLHIIHTITRMTAQQCIHILAV